MSTAWLVQLPFPSTRAPHPALSAYYADYSQRLRSVIPDYFIPDDALWELPMWAAHVAGHIEAAGWQARFVDLSRIQADPESCVEAIVAAVPGGALLLFSPLAQNFDLALTVSRVLMAGGRRTVIGGNMAPLIPPDGATLIHRGTLDQTAIEQLLRGEATVSFPGRVPITTVPSYFILRHYAGRVPLLRISASHGCLYACRFCGDAWSRQLRMVAEDALEAELRQLEALFPETRLFYIGDKTFGQSPQAVAALERVFASRPAYRLIVQTHILNVTPELIETMRRLNVVAVEIGFESADIDMLRESGKVSTDESRYHAVLRRINDAGIRVILNVLGSLPSEREASHVQTVEAIQRFGDAVWLYNLYNFVPYPLTPYFPVLKSRIVNWTFAEWREDAPAIFVPYHQSIDEAWERFLEKIQVAHRVVVADCEAAAI